MSLIKANAVQIGQSPTATQNFTLAVPSAPDGTIKLARGNAGATTQDVLSVDASGNVNGLVKSTGSTTARSLANRFADVVNVKDFGAVSGPSSYSQLNRTAFINAFATVAANGEGTVFIPDGDYYLNCAFDTAFINVPSNCTIQMGKYTRIIVSNNGSTERYIVFNINNKSNVRISGGEIVGDKTTGLAAGFYGYGICIRNGSSNITIENVVIKTCYSDGITIESGTNIRALSLESYDNKRHGGSITGNVSNVWFDKCLFKHSDEYFGFDIETESSSNVYEVIFNECVFSNNNNSTNGIGLCVQQGVGAGVPVRITATKCLFYGNGSTALKLHATEQAIIEGCIFYNNAGDNIYINNSRWGNVNSCLMTNGVRGIYLLRSESFTLSNNNIRSCSDDAIGTIDDTATNPLKNNKIDGNIIDSCLGGFGIDLRGVSNSATNNKINLIGKDGVIIQAGATNCYVIGNDVSNCGRLADNSYRGIIDLSQGNTISNNKVRECIFSQSGTAQAGSTTSITLASTANSLNSSLVGYTVVTTGGTGSGQSAVISNYNGTTKVAGGLTPAFTTAPNNTTTYQIIPTGNRQSYGILLAGTNALANSNDCFLGGKTGTFQNSGTGSSVANNR